MALAHVRRWMLLFALLAPIGPAFAQDARKSVATHQPRATLQYTVTAMGTLPGGSYVTPRAINNRGLVVGEAGAIDGLSHAFLYDNGSMIDLQALVEGAFASSGQGINDAGQIVGCFYSANGGQRAIVFSSDMQLQDLGTLGGDVACAASINQSGQITGWSNTEQGSVVHAFIYDNGVMTDIQAQAGWPKGRPTSPLSINAAGQVVGWYHHGASLYARAFIFSNGRMRDMGTLLRSKSAQVIALGINDSGLAVGTSDIQGLSTQAFLYANGRMKGLGALFPGDSSHAYGINSSGQIVGSSASDVVRAVLIDQGVWLDLNTMLEPVSGAGWQLQYAYAINDSGQIVALGSNSLDPSLGSAVILTPVKSSARH